MSELERAVLAEIERQLVTDRRLVRSMRRRVPARVRRARVRCDAVIVIAGLSALLCLVLGLVGSATAAGVLAAAAFYLRSTLSPRRRW